MDGGTALILISLALLTGALATLAVRGLARFRRSGVRVQLWWALGLALAAAAMAVETIVYAGVVSEGLLAVYVFLSAALVGVLSLGAVRVFRRPRIEPVYAVYILATSVLLAIACAVTPLPGSMVTNGIITGDPPLLLIAISTLITGPATIVLLASAASSLRRARDWRTLLMIAGALVLGAGGTLYIASFPVALYYAEFLGIVLLFAGLVSLKPAAPPAVAPVAAPA